MKIILEEHEIQSALEDYVINNIPMVQGHSFAVNFTGSASKGIEAELSISPKAADEPAPVKAEEKPKEVQKPKAKTKPEPVKEEPKAEVEDSPEPEKEEAPEAEKAADERPEKPAAAESPKRTDSPIFKFAKKA